MRAIRNLKKARNAHQMRVARLAGIRATRAGMSSRSGPSLLRLLAIAAGVFGALVLALSLLMVVISVATWNYYSTDLPEINSVEAQQFETTKIYDRNWKLLYEVNDPQTGFRTYSSLSDITSGGENMNLVNATVAAEDRTFWNNPGVDPVAIVRGTVSNLTGGEASGASTITQQLVRQLYPETIGFERTYVRKIREAIVAIQLSQAYSKEQILEMYFNSTYYGNRAYGIDAAARAYFDKEPGELTLAEASLLAGLPQAPSAYDPTQNMASAKVRQRYVLDQMVAAGYIDESDADAAWNEVLVIFPPDTRLILAPHWVNFVIGQLEEQYGAELTYRGGLNVRTTLDYDLQIRAEQAVNEQLETLAPYNANNAASIAMIPATGEIVAMVGSANYWDDTISGQFNVALSERQPGSTFMPVVYAGAFEQGSYPGTVIMDYPTTYSTPGAPNPVFVPENTSRKFHGPVTAREALARSLNVPAVKTLDSVGISGTIDLAHQMGIRTGLWRGLEFYGVALALGAGEVSPLELTNTYATLANEGRFVPYTTFVEILGPDDETIFRLDREGAFGNATQVVQPETAYLITDILSDNEVRQEAYGPGNPLEFPEFPERQVAAKSGTSFDFLDNWSFGYTTDLAVGVWVGNADNRPLLQLDGIAGAAPVMHQIMVDAHDPEFEGTLERPNGEPYPQRFERPDSIAEVEVCQATGGLPVEGAETYVELAGSRSKPSVRCDQVTEHDLVELQSALAQFGDGTTEFTQEGIERLMDYSTAISGGIGLGNYAANPTPTIPSVVSLLPSPNPRPTATARPIPTTRPSPTPSPTPAPTATASTPQPGLDTVVIPNLFGVSEARAAQILASAGLSLGDVLYITQSDLPPGVNINQVGVGQVFFQSPTAGLSVPAGSSVSVAVRAQ